MLWDHFDHPEVTVRYFLDFEFLEDGRTIDPISLGMVCEDGRELYAEFPFEPTKANEWVKKNVIPHLQGPPYVKPARMVKDDILKFIGADKPEFIAYYADYDWICFCQIFGRMIDLPKAWPMFCLDIKQWAYDLGNPALPKQEKGEHHALADARHNRVMYEFVSKLRAERLGSMLR